MSLDLATARHPQTLLATHEDGQPLPLARGAPMRLLAPMKPGIENIKALTDVTSTPAEPPCGPDGKRVFIVDQFAGESPLPNNLVEIMARRDEIVYSERVRSDLRIRELIDA